ncbi:hypothetical protein [Stygiolobus caldivivus]|uniref:Uncharacterized protein n=1 Tax=Stygiolobus caldivivus TaxID=2824673 RepID=A0A8D5U7Z0_9CREN|nr:hypothetical protein [Stygiolobus caldivivus]BCU71013.1 hypothetical protein KN1_23100 [Stygiolobus caldivivus]
MSIGEIIIGKIPDTAVIKGKVSFLYSLISILVIALSTTLSVSIVPLAVTLGLLFRRRNIVLLELLISLTSFVLLFEFQKLYLYVFTLRALTYINLYFLMSDYVDYHTVLNLLGEKGVPLVVGLAYFPLFNEVMSQIVFNARARKIGFKPSKLLLPFVVQTVKIAEDLYVAYTIKLYGKYRGHITIAPSSLDLAFTLVSVIILLLSVFFPLNLPQYHISI